MSDAGHVHDETIRFYFDGMPFYKTQDAQLITHKCIELVADALQRMYDDNSNQTHRLALKQVCHCEYCKPLIVVEGDSRVLSEGFEKYKAAKGEHWTPNLRTMLEEVALQVLEQATKQLTAGRVQTLLHALLNQHTTVVIRIIRG